MTQVPSRAPDGWQQVEGKGCSACVSLLVFDPTRSHFWFLTHLGKVHVVHAGSGAFDPATTLLEGEFSSNTQSTNLLRPRPRNISRSIQSGTTLIHSSNLRSSSSKLLARFLAHMEIVKFMTTVSSADLITLLAAGILVLSCNPIVKTPTAVLQSPYTISRSISYKPY